MKTLVDTSLWPAALTVTPDVGYRKSSSGSGTVFEGTYSRVCLPDRNSVGAFNSCVRSPVPFQRRLRANRDTESAGLVVHRLVFDFQSLVPQAAMWV